MYLFQKKKTKDKARETLIEEIERVKIQMENAYYNYGNWHISALEVDEKGNLANWMIPGKKTPGMGGAMDLLVGAKKVILTMEHTAKGNHKILKNCRLPLTAAGQVNMIITEMGVMEITPEGIVLTEINPEFTVEQIQEATEAKLIISENLKQVNLN